MQATKALNDFFHFSLQKRTHLYVNFKIDLFRLHLLLNISLLHFTKRLEFNTVWLVHHSDTMIVGIIKMNNLFRLICYRFKGIL